MAETIDMLLTKYEAMLVYRRVARSAVDQHNFTFIDENHQAWANRLGYLFGVTGPTDFDLLVYLVSKDETKRCRINNETILKTNNLLEYLVKKERVSNHDFHSRVFWVIVLGFFYPRIRSFARFGQLRRFFSKHFSNQKFNIKSGYQIGSTTKSSRFVITIYNNNINDTRITGFGLKPKLKHRLLERITNKKTCWTMGEAVIPSRDYISAQVDDKDLEIIISDINRGKFIFSKLVVFVTDSLGLTTKPVRFKNN
ncbi:MAG: hypothetical protein MZU97_22995 [Bacillus subtilis]|nr:hypothetical protein [Bacillus subtilis]